MGILAGAGTGMGDERAAVKYGPLALDNLTPEPLFPLVPLQVSSTTPLKYYLWHRFKSL